MNFLSHYYYNHRACGRPADPDFVMGVALPDLWSRFSRRRRIHWKSVRGAAPSGRAQRQLRAGLLNHAEADRRFHLLPDFLRWQVQVARAADGQPGHPFVREFLAHVAIELALDHRLLRENPGLGEEFYTRLEFCRIHELEGRVAELARVDARGLAARVRDFLTHRFVCRYADPRALQHALADVLALTSVRERPSAGVMARMLDCAIEIVAPRRVWEALGEPDATK